jgi:hypothetical protein
VRRVERALLRVNDELVDLRRQEALAAAELESHRHLDDDARRDAVVTEQPQDVAEARATAKDVARLSAALAFVRDRIRKLEARRDRLLRRL